MRAAGEEGESVVVTYAPDGHRSAFSRAWLAGHALGADGDSDRRTEDAKELWLPVDLGQGRRPRPAGRDIWPSPRTGRAPWTRCSAGASCCSMMCPPNRVRCSRSPRASGSCGRRIHGRLFDVRVEPQPGNLAYTSRRILPHTDNPYRDPVPTIQLLHCLRAADAGGETGLVDGFAAARDLRATDRETFDLIARTPVPFGYQDESAELRASQPLIQLSPHGRIRGIRFNNRSARPLRLPYAEVTAFYAAYRRWAELLARPERQLNLGLTPGDCLIFDNTRVLHARTAFSVTGGRHLQGCYADLDGLASTLAVLRREETP